jgi:hypothetical protein
MNLIVKAKTNTQFVHKLMTRSGQGALVQAFILEAIRDYAERTLKAPDWNSEAMISQDAWKSCAREVLFAIDHR